MCSDTINTSEQPSRRPLLELRNVALNLSGEPILQDINLAIHPGEAVVITGTSGSGKTTLLKTAAGLIQPSAGYLSIEGQRITEIPPSELKKFRGRSGFVFQDAALWANQNIYQNMALPLQVHFPGMSREEQKQRIKNLIDRFHFQDDLKQRPSRLSTGEGKVVSLCRGLITDPSLIYMDEPTTFIDYTVIGEVLRTLIDLKNRGKTLIIVTQDTRVIRNICDRVILLDHGRIIEDGPFQEVIRRPREETRGLIDNILNPGEKAQGEEGL